MKRVLILQHEEDNPKGYVGEILQEHNVPSDVVNVWEEALPDFSPYGAIIAFGGIQHAYEEEIYPYFTEEKVMLSQIVEQDIPFLGICLGGQLLAGALGAAVKLHTLKEVGFYDIALTEEGRKDALYQGLPGYQKVFHWHEDTFDLPQGAVLLATNEGTPHQAFRYGRRAYGLQYHIEVDPTMLDSWLRHSGTEHDIIDMVGIVAYNAITLERPIHFPVYHAHTRIVLKNFLTISGLIQGEYK